MIRLESIFKSYPNGELFSNVSIYINRGMRVGLVGPNGSGKTTLLRIMLGEETSDSGSVQKEKTITIGYLAQDIVAGSDQSIIEEVLAGFPEVVEIERKIILLADAISKEPENTSLVNELGDNQNRFEALGGWTLEKRAKKILGGLGFSDKQFIEPMDVLSGGWRMRVALAAILLKEPDILFLDEPTNHLDLEATIWLETFLSNWKGSMVMISHDREFLDRSVNHILEIDLKRINLYQGNYSRYLEAKALRLEQNRNAYKNQQKKIKDTERFIDRFRYKNTKATQVQSRVKMLEKMERLEEPSEFKSAMNLIIPQPSRAPLNVALCRKVTKHFGNTEVFNEMDLVVERGQKIGLVGINGAGKSTLLKLLAGVEDVTSGDVRIGNGVNRSYYAQHQLEILNPNDTVFDTVRKAGTGWSETEIRSFLGSFLFSGDEIEKYIKILSGGEKARLALARMLVEPAHLLLLDEPTNHLDMVSRNVVEKALDKYIGSIVCISHDRHFLNRITNLTGEVGKGKIRMYEGNYEYYEWKKSKSIQKEGLTLKEKIKPKVKPDYKEKKKLRNRLAWIRKRNKSIETELENQRIIVQDPDNGDNYDVLQKAMELMNSLEKEYFDLLEEEELLKNK